MLRSRFMLNWSPSFAFPINRTRSVSSAVRNWPFCDSLSMTHRI